MIETKPLPIRKRRKLDAEAAKLHDKQSERDHRELRIDKVGLSGLEWSWENPPIDPTHDRASRFDGWQSFVPRPGAWTYV